jgi:hypothetical protein
LLAAGWERERKVGASPEKGVAVLDVEVEAR